jgi:hypothetical protein
MKYFSRKALILFLIRYRNIKNQAKNLMHRGDLSSYISKLVETQNTKVKIKQLLEN